jgi:hypothetical protein
MHTVCELYSFQRAAKDAGMGPEEIARLVSYLAANPQAGDLIEGTGGCRKVRFAKPGKGKSGGYRTITFYTGVKLPVFLLTVFAKGEKVNLSKAERNALGALTGALVEEYRNRIMKVSTR